jgi:hypothetical protein
VVRYGDPSGGGPARIRYAPGTICSVDNCKTPVRGRGLCQYHLQHAIRHGSPTAVPPPARRKRSGRKRKNHDGYVVVYLPEHPNARSSGEVSEHTLVMSAMLGRPIRKGETVHHRNGIRDDNRPENLELWAHMQPHGQRVSDLLAFAREVFDLYGGTEDGRPEEERAG